MLRILESQFVGYLAHRLAGIENPLLGQADQFRLDMLLRRAARLLLDEIAEVVGRQMELPGAVFHRWQTLDPGLLRGEIVVEQTFETDQNVAVDTSARDELPFVEAHAIIEQQLDVGRYEPLGVLVDGVLGLGAYLVQAVDDDLPLLLREVERLVGLVGKERIVAHAAPERRSADQIGMEDERPSLGLEQFAVVLHAGHLPGRDADDGALLVVVILAAVDHIAALHVLEEQGIETERVTVAADHAGLRQVDDRDQRMERLDAHQFVVLENMFEMLDRIHG